MNMLASRGQLRKFHSLGVVYRPLCVLLGFLAGQTGSPDTAWFQSLAKPDIYPEPKWFGIVWTILYVMIGFALALVASAWGARGRTAALWVFAVHFALNLAWSYVFFGAQQITGALVLLVAIVLTLLVVIAVLARPPARGPAAAALSRLGLLRRPRSTTSSSSSIPMPMAEALDGAVERVRI